MNRTAFEITRGDFNAAWWDCCRIHGAHFSMQDLADQLKTTAPVAAVLCRANKVMPVPRTDSTAQT